jgi:hypothetical protein
MVKCSRCGGQELVVPIPEIRSTSNLAAFLDQTYFEALCKGCVQEITQQLDIVEQTSELEPDEFYIEDGLFVFTSYYHMKRGYCCKSRCRHCVYGYSQAFQS